MIKLHQKLHLQHRHHTGKLLHHRHTSYRGIALILVVASAFIIALNMMASATAATFSQADNILVTARNPAPIPTTAAVITSPTSPYTTTSSVVPISGTCPDITPNVFIVIEDNGFPAGSAPCTSDHNFSVTVALEPGVHTLIAQTLTITEDMGPPSLPLIVTYSPRVPTPTHPTPTTPRPSTPIEGYPPLTFHARKPYIIYGPARDAIWIMGIEGGKAPYSVRIDWDDGVISSYKIDGADKDYRHSYRTMQPYTVLATITDARGISIQLTIAAVTPYVTPNVSATAPTMPFSPNNLIGLYGAYLLLIVAVGFLWVRNPRFVLAKQPIPVVVRQKRHSRKHRTGRP